MPTHAHACKRARVLARDGSTGSRRAIPRTSRPSLVTNTRRARSVPPFVVIFVTRVLFCVVALAFAMPPGDALEEERRS